MMRLIFAISLILIFNSFGNPLVFCMDYFGRDSLEYNEVSGIWTYSGGNLIPYDRCHQDEDILPFEQHKKYSPPIYLMQILKPKPWNALIQSNKDSDDPQKDTSDRKEESSDNHSSADTQMQDNSQSVENE